MDLFTLFIVRVKIDSPYPTYFSDLKFSDVVEDGDPSFRLEIDSTVTLDTDFIQAETDMQLQ